MEVAQCEATDVRCKWVKTAGDDLDAFVLRVYDRLTSLNNGAMSVMCVRFVESGRNKGRSVSEQIPSA